MIRLIAVYVRTNNDTNGNPRRGWAIFSAESDDVLIGFVDEGYAGNVLRRTLDEHYGSGEYEVTTIGDLTITPGQYRELKRVRILP